MLMTLAPPLVMNTPGRAAAHGWIAHADRAGAGGIAGGDLNEHIATGGVEVAAVGAVAVIDDAVEGAVRAECQREDIVRERVGERIREGAEQGAHARDRINAHQLILAGDHIGVDGIGETVDRVDGKAAELVADADAAGGRDGGALVVDGAHAEQGPIAVEVHARDVDRLADGCLNGMARREHSASVGIDGDDESAGVRVRDAGGVGRNVGDARDRGSAQLHQQAVADAAADVKGRNLTADTERSGALHAKRERLDVAADLTGPRGVVAGAVRGESGGGEGGHARINPQLWHARNAVAEQESVGDKRPDLRAVGGEHAAKVETAGSRGRD